MNRYVTSGLGLFLAASACSAIGAPFLSTLPTPDFSQAPSLKAPASAVVAGPAKASRQVKQDKHCPYRRT